MAHPSHVQNKGVLLVIVSAIISLCTIGDYIGYHQFQMYLQYQCDLDVNVWVTQSECTEKFHANIH